MSNLFDSFPQVSKDPYWCVSPYPDRHRFAFTIVHDANTFLRAYSEANIDLLEQNGGFALVYNHLAFAWLDTESRRMRQTLVDRLAYIASPNGWFVPASTILDRFEAMGNIHISASDEWVKICNSGESAVSGDALIQAEYAMNSMW